MAPLFLHVLFVIANAINSADLLPSLFCYGSLEPAARLPNWIARHRYGFVGFLAAVASAREGERQLPRGQV